MRYKGRVLVAIFFLFMLTAIFLYLKYIVNGNVSTEKYEKGVYSRRVYLNESLGIEINADSEGEGFIYPKGMVGLTGGDMLGKIWNDESEACCYYQSEAMIRVNGYRVGKLETIDEYMERQYGSIKNSDGEIDCNGTKCDYMKFDNKCEKVDIQGKTFEKRTILVRTNDLDQKHELLDLRYGSYIFEIQVVTYKGEDGKWNDSFENLIKYIGKVGSKEKIDSIKKDASEYQNEIQNVLDEEKNDQTNEYSDDGEVYEKGRINGNVYTNKYLNIKLEIPKGSKFILYDEEDSYEEMIASSPDGKCNTYIAVSYYIMNTEYNEFRDFMMKFKLEDGIGNELYCRDVLDDYLGKKWYRYEMKEVRDDERKTRTSIGYIRKKKFVLYEIGFKYFPGYEKSMELMKNAYSNLK